MPAIQQLLINNRQWAERLSGRDPDFFQRLSQLQKPKYLWIGCADSRVPANEIVGLLPGELLVHRNVANIVVHSDLNCLSVLQFGIEVLGVEHIIVCGHFGCGGVEAVWQKRRLGLSDNWLRHVQDVVQQHGDVFPDKISDNDAVARLCQLNVVEQVVNVCRTTVVDDAWRQGRSLSIHGWIYGLQDGVIRDLGLSVSGEDQLPSLYARAVATIADSPQSR